MGRCTVARGCYAAFLLLACSLLSPTVEAQDFKIVVSKYGYGDCYDGAPGSENRPPRPGCDLNKTYNAAVFSTEDLSAPPSAKNGTGPWRAYPSFKVCPDQDGDGQAKCPFNSGLEMVGLRNTTAQMDDYSKEVNPRPSWMDTGFLEQDENALTFAPDAFRVLGKCSVVMPFIKIPHRYCGARELRPMEQCDDPKEYVIKDEHKAAPHRYCSVEFALQGTPNSPLDCNDNDKAGTLGDTKNFKIVKIEREKAAVDAAFEARGVRPLPGGYYNPYDTLKVTILGDPCFSRTESLRTEVSLQLGESGKRINVGVLEFPYDYNGRRSRFRRTAILKGSNNVGDLEFSGLLSADSAVSGKATPILSPKFLALGNNYGGWFSSNQRTYEQGESEDVRWRDLISLIAEMDRVNAGPGRVFNLKLRVPYGGKNYADIVESFPLPISLCVPVYGNGPHKVKFMRPVQWSKYAGSAWFSRPIVLGQGFVAKVLNKLSPFQQNLKSFSVFADLTLLDEDLVRVDGSYDYTPLEVHRKPLACDFQGVQVFESVIAENAFAMIEDREVYMFPPDTNHALIAEPDMYYVALAHEFGHAFGELKDEYHVWDNDNPSPRKWSWFKSVYGRTNCAPFDELSTRFPPPANQWDDRRSICSVPGLFRSTLNSLMNDAYKTDGRTFNVVSCAEVLARIKGGKAPSYWKTCEGYLDVTKK